MKKCVALVGMGLSIGLARVQPAGADEEKRARVYTNEDLERVRPFRDETGVASKPGPDTAGDERTGNERKAAGAAGTRRKEGHSEEYWREQARRLREKLQGPRDRADELREQIEERRRQPGVRPYSDPRVVALQKRLEVLERRIREAESGFEDRARRQGAMPGWIR